MLQGERCSKKLGVKYSSVLGVLMHRNANLLKVDTVQYHMTEWAVFSTKRGMVGCAGAIEQYPLCESFQQMQD